tara:strand:+ start:3299 stop:5596 length:2298 start_codon:yes stop_codon:yes gene_type:complete
MFSVNLKNEKTGYYHINPIGLMRSRYEIIPYMFIGILAVILRFWDLGYRSVGYDESLHLFYAYQLFQGLGYEHTPVTHGPFQFHGIALLHFLFGDTEYTSRMLSAIFGSMVVLMPYFLRDKLGSYGSVITSALLAFSPTMLFYSRYARNDMIMVFWTFAIIVCFWRYLDCGKSRYLYMTSIFLSLAFATKETTFIVLAIVGSYLLITSSTDWIPWILRKRVFINEGSFNKCNDEAYRYSENRGFYYGSLPRKKTLKNFSRSGIFMILLFSLSVPQMSAAISLIQIGTFPIPVLSTLLQFTRDFLYESGIILANTSAPEGYPSGQIIFDIYDTQVTKGLIIALMLVATLIWFSAAFGTAWNKMVWIKCALLFYSIWIVFYTTIFTNISGIGSGIWQSLGYWLVQQDVNRGDQPWYYYLVISPVYELLPFVLSIIAITYYFFKGTKFTRFLAFWCFMTFVLYSMAGEKMPWLLVNIALPMILVSGKFLGDIASNLRWEQVRKQGGLWLIPLSWLFLYLLYRMLIITSYGKSFGDLLQIFITTFVFCLVIGLSLRVLNRASAANPFGLVVLSFAFVLVLFGARSAIITSFDDHVEPNEMIVYAQTSQRVPIMIGKIQSILDYSKENNKEFHVIVDKDVYWGLSWYLRAFENIRYEDFSYIEVSQDGWPIQSPESSVLILSEYNENNLFARLGNYDEGERFNYLWWPPEEYKPCKENQKDSCVTPGKAIKNMATSEKWKELFRYMIHRETEAEFLHHDAILYTGMGDKE